jgi:hypothetical protein
MLNFKVDPSLHGYLESFNKFRGDIDVDLARHWLFTGCLSVR